MTDKIECVAVLKDDADTQLYDTALYIKVLGGIQSITLRYGDQKVRPLRLPTSIESKLSVVILQGEEFDTLAQTNLLRMVVYSALSEVPTFALDLTGLPEAILGIANGRPVAIQKGKKK